MKRLAGVILISLFTMGTAFAEEMQPVNALIKNFNQNMQSFRRQTDLPVLFPAMLPWTSKIKFITFNKLSAHAYQLIASHQANCAGTKACTDFMINAEVGGNPSIIMNIKNQPITEKVSLSHGKTGYFTPGHAIGSYMPPQIQFRCKNILYTFSWSVPVQAEKRFLTYLATSATEKQANCE